MLFQYSYIVSKGVHTSHHAYDVTNIQVHYSLGPTRVVKCLNKDETSLILSYRNTDDNQQVDD